MRMVDYVSWLSVLSVTQIYWVNITEFIQPEDGGGGEAVAGVVGPFEEKKVYKAFSEIIFLSLLIRNILTRIKT